MEENTQLPEQSAEKTMMSEMDEFMPSYIFIDSTDNRLTFFTRDDAPFFKDEDGETRWFVIDPSHLSTVQRRLDEITAAMDSRYGVYGYVVPLQESPLFEEMVDVSAFMHNLMFWEGMIDYRESGPLMQRFMLLAERANRMTKEKDEAVEMLAERKIKIPADEESIAGIVGKAIEHYEQLLSKKSKTKAAQYAELMKMIQDTEKECQEFYFRNDMFIKQLVEWQARMLEELSFNSEKKSLIDRFEEAISEFFNGSPESGKLKLATNEPSRQ